MGKVYPARRVWSADLGSGDLYPIIIRVIHGCGGVAQLRQKIERANKDDERLRVAYVSE